MNLNLIHTENYLLLTDKDAEIKEDDLFYPLDKNVSMGITRKTPLYIKYMHTRNCVKIVAYYPLTKEAKELDLPLLPNPLKEGVDVEQLSHRYYSDLEEKREKAKNFKGQVAGRHPDMLTSKEMYAAMGGFVYGYKAAQSKQQKAINFLITLKDSIESFEYSVNQNSYLDEKIDEFIQSISTQQLPIKFTPEYRYYYHSSKEFYSDAGFVECSKEQYESIKVEVPTWLLKAEIKTIVNSEGKEELVGYYKY